MEEESGVGSFFINLYYSIRNMWLPTAVLSLALARAAGAAPSSLQDRASVVERDGTQYNVYEHAATGSKMEFVKNSGICETTPGVNQYSGYLSVGENMHMWFWYVVPTRRI